MEVIMSSISAQKERKIFVPPVFTRWPKWVRWTVLGVVLAGLGAGAFTYIQARQAATAAAATTSTLQTATARQGNLILQASGSGYLVATSESSVGFDLNGKLASLAVKLGDQVEKGQLLAQLEDGDLQDALTQAE